MFKQSYNYYKEGQDIKGMASTLLEEGKYYDRLAQFEQANTIYNIAEELINTNDIGSLLPMLYTTLIRSRSSICLSDSITEMNSRDPVLV